MAELFAVAKTAVFRNKKMIPGGTAFPIFEREIDEMRARGFSIVNKSAGFQGAAAQDVATAGQTAFDAAKHAANVRSVFDNINDDGTPKGIPLMQPPANQNPDVVESTKPETTQDFNLGNIAITPEQLAQLLFAREQADDESPVQNAEEGAETAATPEVEQDTVEAAEPETAPKMGGKQRKTTTKGPAKKKGAAAKK